MRLKIQITSGYSGHQQKMTAHLVKFYSDEPKPRSKWSSLINSNNCKLLFGLIDYSNSYCPLRNKIFSSLSLRGISRDKKTLNH